MNPFVPKSPLSSRRALLLGASVLRLQETGLLHLCGVHRTASAHLPPSDGQRRYPATDSGHVPPARQGHAISPNTLSQLRGPSAPGISPSTLFGGASSYAGAPHHARSCLLKASSPSFITWRRGKAKGEVERPPASRARRPSKQADRATRTEDREPTASQCLRILLCRSSSVRSGARPARLPPGGWPRRD